ncbi:MAG: hypothetical protein H6741_33290 [Alphaproteobacteria bacterium]|nr:hypothetical protein [Alphaproteobacteria bacterium]
MNQSRIIGHDLLSVPMGDMIRQMALSIAEAQFELDKSSIMVAEMMGGQRLLRDEEGRLIDYDGNLLVNQRDEGGNAIYDERGNLVYEEGQGPRVIDSRVFFGYSYEPVIGEDGEPVAWPNGATKMVRKPRLVSMLELGFTPNFYQFVDTIIEVKIAIKMTQSTEDTTREQDYSKTTTQQDLTQTVKTGSYSYNQYSGSSYGFSMGQFGMHASRYQGTSVSGTNYRTMKTGTRNQVAVQNVDAQYTSKYNYSAEGASLLRTKLVPVPPPAILEERIRDVMEEEKAYQRLAAQGVHGVLETVGVDTEPVNQPVRSVQAKEDRFISDRGVSTIPGGAKVYAPAANLVATTGTFSSTVSENFTFIIPGGLRDGTFRVHVAVPQASGGTTPPRGSATLWLNDSHTAVVSVGETWSVSIPGASGPVDFVKL